MAKKKLKSLKTGTASRSFSIASLTVKAATRAAGHALGGLLQSETAKKARDKAHLLLQAQSLVQQLGELKGSLQKTGQMLSIYGEHFLPAEISAVLRTLQSDSPPVEWPEMEKTLRRRLPEARLRELEIEPEPCGAASLGQVHAAVVRKSGEHLALKIQYPGVEKSIDSDLKALRRILSLTDWLPKLPATEDLFEEVRSMLKREVDYGKEADTLAFFGKELAGDPRYVVPRTFPAYSGAKVLAMSFEEGVAIDSPEVAALSQDRRNALALSVLDLYFRELFLWRRVQTDPHFGNYRVRLGRGGEPDQLVLLDFGAMRDLPAVFMEKYTELLGGSLHQDRPRLERGGERLGLLEASDPAELKDLFYRLCVEITEPFLEPQPFAWAESDLPRRVAARGWEIFRRFPLRTPPRELVFLDRKMAGVFTLLARLGAKVNGRELLLRHLPRG